MKIKFPFPLPELQIKLLRGPCLGECPFYEIIITGLGDVVYDGKMFVRELGERHDKVDVFDVLDLFKFAVEIGFFEMRAYYHSEEQITLGDEMTVELFSMTATDQPYYDVTITTGKQTKKVRNYLGGPKRLRQLENKIEKLANVKRWAK